MIVPKYFAGVFDILCLFAVGLILGLVVIEPVGIFDPGRDVDFYAEWTDRYCGPLGGVLGLRLISV